MIAFVNRPWHVIQYQARELYVKGSTPGIQTAIFLNDEDCRALATGVVPESLKDALAFAAYPAENA